MPKNLCLFDVDGTLTNPRKVITPKMKEFLKNFKEKCPLAVVGGSDYAKIVEQLDGQDMLGIFDYIFSENGLVAYKDGALHAKNDIASALGEEYIQKFINFCLNYLSNVVLPVKRGTFVEFRTGMINISPIGRSCSQKERDEFEAYDKLHHVRKNFVQAMRNEFGTDKLEFAIGGQISIDVYPVGWNKCYCLQFLKDYTNIHFFGDKTHKGGNDYDIFASERTIGYTVKSPEDTKTQLEALFP